ncbi:hypothetical protein P3514_34675, partial [Vibrio parahaemolyticus]|nr:hypothetical protein [Vibrio parahaemolyticus]
RSETLIVSVGAHSDTNWSVDKLGALSECSAGLSRAAHSQSGRAHSGHSVCGDGAAERRAE